MIVHESFTVLYEFEKKKLHKNLSMNNINNLKLISTQKIIDKDDYNKKSFDLNFLNGFFEAK